MTMHRLKIMNPTPPSRARYQGGFFTRRARSLAVSADRRARVYFQSPSSPRPLGDGGIRARRNKRACNRTIATSYRLKKNNVRQEKINKQADKILNNRR